MTRFGWSHNPGGRRFKSCPRYSQKARKCGLFVALIGGERVEGAPELRVVAVDQEAHAAVAVVDLEEQVASLLRHPRGVRVAAAGEALDAAAAEREEDEYEQTLEPDRVDGEEVAGENRLAVRS